MSETEKQQARFMATREYENDSPTTRSVLRVARYIERRLEGIRLPEYATKVA